MQNDLFKGQEVKGLIVQITFFFSTYWPECRREFYQAVNRVDGMALIEIKSKQYIEIPKQQRNWEGIKTLSCFGIWTNTKSGLRIISLLSKLSMYLFCDLWWLVLNNTFCSIDCMCLIITLFNHNGQCKNEG